MVRPQAGPPHCQAASGPLVEPLASQEHRASDGRAIWGLFFLLRKKKSGEEMSADVQLPAIGAGPEGHPGHQ